MSEHGGDGLELEEEHEEHENHEAWVIPYADMLTLLMALFMMLFAISSVDLAKFEKLAGGLRDSLGGGGSGLLQPGDGVVAGGADAGGEATVEVTVPDPAPMPQVAPMEEVERAEQAEQALAREERRAAAVAEDHDQLAAIEQRISEQATAAGISGSVASRQEARGLVVTVVADQIMFRPGEAEMQPAGAHLLAELAGALRDVPNAVTIEGHTDDVPINTSRFRSNWELSTARATEVLLHLVDLGVSPSRLAASGYGEQRPLAPNDQLEGRAVNRRVEVVIHSLVIEG